MLRGFLPEKIQAIIEYYLKEQNGKYSFVIIDGVVDMVYDFNSLPESRKISAKLLEWSAKYNCHITSVLHTNKDFGNARGHLGAELMNKSETVFRVTKDDNNTSTVDCELSRNEGFNQFKFSIENGLPKRKDLPTGFCKQPVEEIPLPMELPANNYFYEVVKDSPF